MKDKIQAAIDHHRAESDRLHEEKKDSIARLKTYESYDGDMLLAYGNAIKKIENEMREHGRAVATLGLLLKQA